MSILELKDVKYTYHNQYLSVDALKGVSYTFEKGKMYAVVGNVITSYSIHYTKLYEPGVEVQVGKRK